MVTGNKCILLISPEPWDHIFVSKHHYAVHLGKRGNKVYFLNPPFNRNEIIKTKYENVWQVNYRGFPRGLRFYPPIFQRYFTKKVFEQLQLLCKIDFDVIWSFDNSAFYEFGALPEKVLKISHIVDLNQDFQRIKAASTADVCIGVSTSIVNRLKAYNNNVFFINHGCQICEGEGKVVLPGNNKIKATYAGNLDIPYIDWSLFKKIISDNKEVDFLLIGPWSESEIKHELETFSNVYYIGTVKSEKLKHFYVSADILLLVYKADEFQEQLSNPHKMMEYLKSGKMIVATFTQEYKDLEKIGVIAMSKMNEEYPQLFKDVIESLNSWNSATRQSARKAFALDNTYDKQIERIEKAIENTNKKKQ